MPRQPATIVGEIVEEFSLTTAERARALEDTPCDFGGRHFTQACYGKGGLKNLTVIFQYVSCASPALDALLTFPKLFSSL